MKKYKFELPELKFKDTDLEPYIDAETFSYHHGKHFQAYVNNLNNALESHEEFHDWPLEKILFNLDKMPEEIRTAVQNNGGGVYNHDVYFSLMAKDSKGPEGELLEAINKAFGSKEEMLKKLKAEALGTFGSGWAWVVSDKEGNLKIIQTSNQITPIKDGLYPVLVVDVWEHAYYIQYRNDRGGYYDKWENVINWEEAAKLYEKRNTLDYSAL